jgi:hypothetical protein
MARAIEWDGQVIALLIEPKEGDPYIAPPIVFDTDEQVIMGAEVLAAVVQSGVTIEHPVIRNCTPERLALIDQQLARISTELGVPVSTL